MGYRKFAIGKLVSLGTRYMPFADVASEDVPLRRLLRLSLFQITVGMAMVLLVGTLNRVMIVELGVSATLVAAMLALPLVFAPFRALVGYKSDTFKSALGLRRLPYIFKGTMLQFGGFAIMPFALLMLSGYGESFDDPKWIGVSAAALAFLLVGAGIHIVQTVGLALATDLVAEEDQPKVVGLMYVMLLVGMIVSAFIFSTLLENYTPGKLVQVIQGSAVVTVVLNGIAMWKQEAMDRKRAARPATNEQFSDAWATLTTRAGMKRHLILIALGTAGFGMADVLLEPFGGQALGMTVAETTRLTIVLALGSLVGFGMASYWIANKARPVDVATLGAVIGVPAFVLVIASALLPPLPHMLVVATLLAGVGAGLFGHGTLTATMRSAPREQIGLSLGAWGAVQTTAAGIAITVGGVIRDVMLLSPVAGASAARPYIPVFALEAALLIAAFYVARPLRRTAGQPTDTVAAADGA